MGAASFLTEILDSIVKINEYIEGISIDEYEEDYQTQDSVHMRLQIIGESAAKISPKIRTKYKNIPWRKIISLRNFISHDYTINPRRIYAVLKKDLVELKKNVKTIIEET